MSRAKDEIGVFRVFYRRGEVVIRTAPMEEAGAIAFAERLKETFGVWPRISRKNNEFRLSGLNPWTVALRLWHQGLDIRLKRDAPDRWRKEQEGLER